MKVEVVPVGSRLVDSYPFSIGGTKTQAEALKRTAVDGLIGYLGHMTPQRLAYVLDAGLGFVPVTKAGEYEDGPQDEVGQLQALGLPKGTHVFLDLEGLKAFHTDPLILKAKINAWGDGIMKAEFLPCLYVGAPQPLTGPELYSLKVYRYWLGIGRCRDRLNDDAYPDCGWCIRQDWHGNPEPGRPGGMYWRDSGVFVDTNSVQRDHRGRLPSWVVR